MNASELIEKILTQSPRIRLGGSWYYIVERDRKIAEEDVENYAEAVAKSADPAQRPASRVERLLGATVDDKLIRWSTPAVLTFGYDEASFAGHPDWLATAKDMCSRAAEDWNEAAREQGIDQQIRFEEVSGGVQPVFTIAHDGFAGRPGLLALAFFPNDPVNQRTVYIGPGSFASNLPYDQVGIIRHEFGHVLGFRHEHIRDEAQQGMSAADRAQMEQWVTGGLGAEELGDFDGQSVMHYPLNNHGTLDFKLSDLDKAGFGKLYSMPKDSPGLREYPI